jgi:hypothetical protein
MSYREHCQHLTNNTTHSTAVELTFLNLHHPATGALTVLDLHHIDSNHNTVSYLKHHHHLPSAHPDVGLQQSPAKSPLGLSISYISTSTISVAAATCTLLHHQSSSYSSCVHRHHASFAWAHDHYVHITSPQCGGGGGGGGQYAG